MRGARLGWRILLFCLLLLLLSGRCRCAELRGSIRVELRCGGQAVCGGSLRLYCVATWQPTGLGLCGEFQDWGSLPEHYDPETAGALADFAEDREIVGCPAPVGEDGTAEFEALSPGLYLIVQDETTPGYAAFCPFLVCLTEEENSIVAAPKIAPEEPTDPRLPQTGQLKWPVPLLLGGGVLLCAAGLLLLRRGKGNAQ
ncbi:MAG: LPXTG cell wall anchor domain-containing protein [Oscillospiraceae bacterium]|nr:LPXTG cell wall anchor domain-containing protein [Oscillospiraceae bacterium]